MADIPSYEGDGEGNPGRQTPARSGERAGLWEPHRHGPHTLTPKRLEVLRLVRRHRPASLRELAGLARRDPKNVLADVKALETLGLIESEGRRGERYRKRPRTEFGRIEVHVEL